jgi:hypothetical protein
MLGLARGDDAIVVVPEHGAAIVGWSQGGTDLSRHPSSEAVLPGQPHAGVPNGQPMAVLDPGQKSSGSISFAVAK